MSSYLNNIQVSLQYKQQIYQNFNRRNIQLVSVPWYRRVRVEYPYPIVVAVHPYFKPHKNEEYP